MYSPVTGPGLNADAAPQIDEHLSKNEWFAGGEGPTVADYMMIFPLELLRQSGSRRQILTRILTERKRGLHTEG